MSDCFVMIFYRLLKDANEIKKTHAYIYNIINSLNMIYYNESYKLISENLIKSVFLPG